MNRNQGIQFDGDWLNASTVNTWSVYDSLKEIPGEKCRLHGVHRAAWLLKAVSCIDLTTLSGDDTRCNVVRLCQKALRPVKASILKTLGFTGDFTTAAVCVYPNRIPDVTSTVLSTAPLRIAAVAAGFPSGQYGLSTRLEEINHAVKKGADEIDVVIDRSLVLTGQWSLLYDELKAMKVRCGSAKMKTILSTGELLSFDNVYKASLVAMMAGSDFIKTSTGKEAVNATLPVGLVMLRAIKEYHRRTGVKVGFKAAGGIRTADDALDWLILVKRELGNEWLSKDYFRIGASGLLSDIEKNLQSIVDQPRS